MNPEPSELTKQLDAVVADLRDRMPLMIFHPPEGKDQNHPLTGDTFIKVFDVLRLLSSRIDAVERMTFLLHDQQQNHLALTKESSEQISLLCDQMTILAGVVRTVNSGIR